MQTFSCADLDFCTTGPCKQQTRPLELEILTGQRNGTPVTFILRGPVSSRSLPFAESSTKLGPSSGEHQSDNLRLILLYCFQVSGSKQEEELSLVQFHAQAAAITGFRS